VNLNIKSGRLINRCVCVCAAYAHVLEPLAPCIPIATAYTVRREQVASTLQGESNNWVTVIRDCSLHVVLPWLAPQSNWQQHVVIQRWWSRVSILTRLKSVAVPCCLSICLLSKAPGTFMQQKEATCPTRPGAELTISDVTFCLLPSFVCYEGPTNDALGGC